jgi:hypothetical protein
VLISQLEAAMQNEKWTHTQPKADNTKLDTEKRVRSATVNPNAPFADGRTTAIFPANRTDDAREAQSPYDCIDERSWNRSRAAIRRVTRGATLS